MSVALLAEQGPLLGEPYTKQLDRKLRELRFHLERRAVRRRALARCFDEAHEVVDEEG